MGSVSSNIVFPYIKPSLPGGSYVPTPRIQFRPGVECKHLDTTPRESPSNVLTQWKPSQYHLIKRDLSERRYQHDVLKAIGILYSDYRGPSWKSFSTGRIVGVESVGVIVPRLKRMLVHSRYGSFVRRERAAFNPLGPSRRAHSAGHL